VRPVGDGNERVSTRIEKLVAGESSPTLLHRDVDEPFNNAVDIERVVLDEESLPFDNDTFDAVVSAGSMHWINDLPQCLREVNRVLKPDAPFVAAMFGGDTLYELRTSLQLAEQERMGGVSPRVSPLADTRDMGSLLDKAGFNLLTIDVDDIIIDFPNIFALMTDLQAMAEGNAVLGRKEGQISRDVLMAAEGIYRQLHGNTDDTLPATFRVIYMVGCYNCWVGFVADGVADWMEEG
jgi:NADH dehydrogenase [ubiquinone] 1 alpha subcomplex assembly factor 5